MLRTMQIALVLLLALPVTVWADLTGVWKADDGGTYYLRQVGSNLHWFGEHSNNHPAWANVFRGDVHGNRITGNWIDVPKGHAMSRGMLKLEVRHNENVLVVEQQTGGFGGARWTRVGYNPAPVPQPAPPTSLNEDCIGFSHANAQVRNVNGSWKIVDGNHSMFDFGANRPEAIRSLQVIQHYRLNNACFVGRPGPSFTYMKRGNAAPVGAMPGEDCIGFNTHNAGVRQISGSWKIVDGSQWMFDFGGNRQEAETSLHIIQQYGFNKTCYVGRPNPSFSYLRR